MQSLKLMGEKLKTEHLDVNLATETVPFSLRQGLNEEECRLFKIRNLDNLTLELKSKMLVTLCVGRTAG